MERKYICVRHALKKITKKVQQMTVKIHKGFCFVRLFDDYTRRTSDIECKHNGDAKYCQGCVITTGMPSNRGNINSNLFEGKTLLPVKKEETDKEKRWKRVG